MSLPIKTSRLILRQWRIEDFDSFADMNADPLVREFFPSTLSHEQSHESAAKIMQHIQENHWGLWAVSIPRVTDFAGFIGLNPVSFTAHFTPAIEIGWRLATKYWGYGYATEGANAALQYAFEDLNLKEIVSFTTLRNIRSQQVMKKIGLRHNPADDFLHPLLPAGNPCSEHVLYRLKQEEWQYLQTDIKKIKLKTCQPKWTLVADKDQ